MSDNISMKATNIFKRSIKTFTNLLKEFPKNAVEDFIYDDSTLKKIEAAGDALTDMTTFFKQEATHFKESERDTVKKALKILSQLMDELPKDSADEFMYDRMIHRMVEESRETITKLNHLFS